MIRLYIPSDDLKRLPLRDALKGIKAEASKRMHVFWSNGRIRGIINMGGIIFSLVKTRRDNFRPSF